MKIYGLYGKSGTGKSYQALHLAYRLRAEGIIDDGLFIYGNQVVAGISAKREKTKIGAIRTALFVKDELCREVKEKIEEMQPARLLVLGTSENMVKKIVQRLELPEPVIWIPIEQITTEKERERAHSQRKEKGKHVIPAPTFQIK
ncbi:MAG TPA: Asp23/Gls24 family envelope stress response protein, partial [Clostridiales bacterium]|nr:Asp23/Gls24 family envelope stress response protein [Clostridiales bacterium]